MPEVTGPEACDAADLGDDEVRDVVHRGAGDPVDVSDAEPLDDPWSTGYVARTAS
jgi:hypothetical protein